MAMAMGERGPRHSCCLLYSGACIEGSSLGTYKSGKAIPPPRICLSEPAEQITKLKQALNCVNPIVVVAMMVLTSQYAW